MNHQLQVLQTLSSTDALTQMANRRYFEVFFEQEWRRSLRNAVPHSASTVSAKVTVSLGISTIIPKPESSPSALIAEADQALLAKHEGRNRLAYFHLASRVTPFSDIAPSPRYGAG